MLSHLLVDLLALSPDLIAHAAAEHLEADVAVHVVVGAVHVRELGQPLRGVAQARQALEPQG